jgi:hypothetical protein
MRKMTCFVLAAAFATAPALAQDNNVVNAPVDANATATVPADNMVVANDLAVAPAPVTTETAAPAATSAPEPRKSSGGFPWGVVGLVGLVGLLGRKRRD